MSRESFICPHCHRKHLLSDAFRVRPGHSFLCGNCGREAMPRFQPVLERLWDYTFGFGFLFAVIIVKLYLMIEDNIVNALLTGALVGILVVLGMLLYIRKTTTFEK